jgi:hypothetical protein
LLAAENLIECSAFVAREKGITQFGSNDYRCHLAASVQKILYPPSGTDESQSGKMLRQNVVLVRAALPRASGFHRDPWRIKSSRITTRGSGEIVESAKFLSPVFRHAMLCAATSLP